MTLPEKQPAENACPMRHGPARSPGARAVFLDRDGVLIEDTGYPDNPDAIRLLPGVGEALRLLRARGWALVVVSNQSGVARGKFDLDRLDAIHNRLRELLGAEAVALDALYFCPHHPQGRPPFQADCDHRKPQPGMLRTAARELGLSLPDCWMVGDKESDVEAGGAAGCRTILVTGRPGSPVPDLLAAARLILGD